MKEFEVFLKNALEQKDKYNSVNFISIKPSDRTIIDKLKDMGLIEKIRYIGMAGVGFDITYDGIHYFDE